MRMRAAAARHLTGRTAARMSEFYRPLKLPGPTRQNFTRMPAATTACVLLDEAARL